MIVQCADFAERELDIILFGGAKGEPGLIQQAQYGVLFFDEINELPPNFQARLARALSDNGIHPSDGAAPIPIRAKILSSSAVPIAQCNLRPDLIYRLSGASLELPMLSDREDFDSLTDKLIRLFSVRQPHAVSITDAARVELRSRAWPGNIRELKNTLQVAVAMSDRGVIELEHIPAPVIAPRQKPQIDRDAELQALLISCGWNNSRVARLKGVDRSTIHRQMKHAELKRP